MTYSPHKTQLKANAAEPKLVVIVGETASGKSALAMHLAKQFKGEIISADSWAVYKGFDIGTAKATPEEQKQVRHHLIDIADPLKGFNAALFQHLAKRAINDIARRDKLPILVGGTGLYIDSVLYNYSFLPATDPKLRKQLNAMSLQELLTRAETEGLDTGGVDLRNKRRVIRLIENNGVRPTKRPLRTNTLIIGLSIPRQELIVKIRRRIDAMISSGFIEEVEALLARYPDDIEAFRAPGYRAFKEYVQGKISLEQAKERFKQNDLQLAKKQRTWFKRNKSIHWIKSPQESVELVTTFLNK